MTLNGNPPPLFGIANFKITKKRTKKINNGHTSCRSCDRRDFSLNLTSTMTGHVSEIHKSLSEVPMGFLVSNTFTYCSVNVFLTLIKDTELQVSRFWYHLSEVSSSNTTLLNSHLLYCCKKSFNETFLVVRTTSTVSHWTLIVLYTWIAPVIKRIKNNINHNHFFIITQKTSNKTFHFKYSKSGMKFNENHYAKTSPIFSSKYFLSPGSHSNFGYFSNNRLAHSWISSKNLRSDNISSGISDSQDCIVPRICPAPRFCKSNSASLKPSLVSSIAFNLLPISPVLLLVSKKQYD